MTAQPPTGVSATTRPRCGGRSPPTTSWRSWPSTTPPPRPAKRARSCAAKGLYSSLITDWRRQHRQGLLKAAVGRSDGGRGGPSLLGGGQAASRERAAPHQAGPGRSDHRCPGKSARALGGDLEERGPRRRHLNAVLDAAVDELVARRLKRRRACQVLGRSRASHYRRRRAPLHGPPAPRPRSHRALSRRGQPRSSRRSTASGSATSPPPRSGPPSSTKAPTWPRSPPCTGSCEPQPRSGNDAAQPAVPPTVKPELVATAPNQVWSWDITKLAGPYKWTWFQLYVILDVYSRYAVGWLVAPRESARLAEELIAGRHLRHTTCHPGSSSLHADRGSSMTSKTVTQLLADLGVAQIALAGRTSPTTTPTAKPSSRPSSTSPPSRNASPASPTPAASATRSSTTTTTTTATPASASTPPPTSTTAEPPPSGPTAKPSSTPPTTPAPNDSADHPPRPGSPRQHGSTHPRRHRWPPPPSEQPVSHPR